MTIDSNFLKARDHIDQAERYLKINSANQAIKFLDRAQELLSLYQNNNWYNYTILLKIKSLILNQSYDIALNYCKSLEASYFLVKDYRNLCILLMEWSNILNDTKQFTKAKLKLLQAKSLLSHKQNKDLAPQVYALLGYHFGLVQDNRQSLIYYQKASAKIDNKTATWCFYANNLASAYESIYFLDQALNLYQKALSLSIELKLGDLSTNLMEAISRCYLKLGDQQNQRAWEQKMLKMNQLKINQL